MRTRSEAARKAAKTRQANQAARRKAYEAKYREERNEELATKIEATALAVTSERSDVVYTEADLDLVRDEVKHLMVATAAAYCEIGKRLAAVHVSKLWKQRLLPDGRQAFTSFEMWCEGELNIRRSNAYSMMSVAKTFTARDVEHYGKTILANIASMPPELHADLLADADAGKLTTRKLKAKATEHKTLTGYVHVHGDDTKTREATVASMAARAAKANEKTPREKHEARNENARAKVAALEAAKTQAEIAASRPTDQITVSSTTKRHVVPLYRKPEGFNVKDPAKLVRARLTKHMPFGRVELSNEVTMSIAIVPDKDGALTAVLIFERDDEPST